MAGSEEENLEYVRTLYDFTGNNPEDLPFKKGEILIILEKPEEQWWIAKSKEGHVGMIPVPYVNKVVRPSPDRADPGQPAHGFRNSESYRIPEPANTHAQPQIPSPLQPGTSGVVIPGLASVQKSPVMAKDIQKQVSSTSLAPKGTVLEGHLSQDAPPDDIVYSCVCFKRESISLRRSRNLPSLSQMKRIETKASFRIKRSHSLNDVILLDKTEKITPDISVVENNESYRFHCTQAGLFQCKVTGLVFKMETEGDVTYRTVPWNQRLLEKLGKTKRPAGPLFDIQSSQGSVCQLHLRHCEILSMGGAKSLYVAHVMDEGIELIKPSVITETHVIINVTGFSCYGVVNDDNSRSTSTPGLLTGVRKWIRSFFVCNAIHARVTVLYCTD